MTFIVEDGSGMPDATSYVSVEFASAYLREDWMSEALKEQAEASLERASEYIDLRWGALLLSAPLTAEQSFLMPRQPFVNRHGHVVKDIPISWKRAVCLYAQQDMEGKLYPSTSVNKQALSKKRVTVGPITTDYEFLEGSSATDWNVFPLADALAQASTTEGASAPVRTKGVMRN